MSFFDHVISAIFVAIFAFVAAVAFYSMAEMVSREKEKYAECKTLHVPIYMCDGHKLSIKDEQ